MVNNYFSNKLVVPIEKVRVKSLDDIELLSWYYNKDLKKYKTILFLHGNAGALENRIYKLNHFKNMDINFLIISWRGFNGNKGKPTEKGLYKDARGAVAWLKTKGITEKDIVLYGESLGTGIAIEIAQNKNFAGVILESPYTSMIDLGKDKYPFLPVKLLLRDKYESINKIKNINSPILVMHGKADNIVPFYMGKKLYKYANEPKYFYFSEYDDHMMKYDEKLLKVLKEFFQSLN
tara:strand:- start:1067 stop:1771 length:705 start_codon:yes stop_codon:yes gene_type:complete